MAYEADRVVVELIAKTDNFDKPVKQSATTFSAATKSVERDAVTMTAAQFKAAGGAEGLAKSFAKVEPAAQGASRGLRQAQQQMRNLGFQISDIGTQLSTGTSPFVVLAQQGPQVANALDGAKGAVGRFASFLSGPYGAAILAVTSILGAYLLKNRETSESVEDLTEKLKENAEKAENTRRAQAIFGQTLEGVTNALDDNEEALKRVNQGHVSAAKQALTDAIAANLRLENIRNETQALLEQARAQIELDRARIKTAGLDPRVAGPIQGDIDASLARIDELQRRVQSTTTQITRSQQQIAEAASHVAVEAAEKMSDPVSRIEVKYDRLIESARQRLLTEHKTSEEIARQTALLIKQRDAEIEAARESKKKTSSGLGGREISSQQAVEIARLAGLQINSAQRTYQEQKRLYDDWVKAGRPSDNPVAKPGTSAHEGVRGRWALDIQFAPGLTAQKLRKIYGDQGVSLATVFKERGHFHIEGSSGRADATADAAARAEEQERQRVLAYLNEKADAEAQILDARQALLTSAAEIAKIEEDAVKAAHDKYEQNVNALQEAGKLLPEEAKKLKQLNDEREKLRLELVRRREAERRYREQEEAYARARDFQTASIDAESDLLQSQVQLATTAKERRAIELRLLELQFMEERLKNQYIIDWAARVQANKDATDKEKADAALAAQIAQMRQSTIDQRQANSTYANSQANAGPLKAYLDSIPKTADEIDAALENIAAHGLDEFASGIADAVLGFKSLGEVARSILIDITKMLIELAVKLLVVKALEAIGIGLAGGGPVPGKASGGRIGFAGGGRIPGFPFGGLIGGVGGPTSDSNLIYASRGEFMIRTKAAKNIGYDALEYMNRYGRLPGMADDRRFAPTNVPAAVHSAGGAFSSDDIRVLRGILSEAARTVPDVNLYASLDPADMLQRALGTPAGSRALLAHLGNNAGAVKAQINR